MLRASQQPRGAGGRLPGPRPRSPRLPSPRPRAGRPTTCLLRTVLLCVLTAPAFFPSSLHRFSPTRPCAVTGPRQEQGSALQLVARENLAQTRAEFSRSAKSQRGPRAGNWGGVDSPAPNGEGDSGPQARVRPQPVGDPQGGGLSPPASSLASRSHPRTGCTQPERAAPGPRGRERTWKMAAPQELRETCDRCSFIYLFLYLLPEMTGSRSCCYLAESRLLCERFSLRLVLGAAQSGGSRASGRRQGGWGCPTLPARCPPGPLRA